MDPEALWSVVQGAAPTKLARWMDANHGRLWPMFEVTAGRIAAARPSQVPLRSGQTFTIPVKPGSAREGVLDIYGRLRVIEDPDLFDPNDPDDADAILVASYLRPPYWADGKLRLPLDQKVLQAFMDWTDYATSVLDEAVARSKGDPEGRRQDKAMARAAETLSGVFLTALRKAQARGPKRNPGRRRTSADLSPAQRRLSEHLGEDYLTEFVIPIPERLQRKHGAAPYYTCDLAYPAARHIIEVDGTSHDRADKRAYDKTRVAALRDLGWTVERVRNEAVYRDVRRGARRNPDNVEVVLLPMFQKEANRFMTSAEISAAVRRIQCNPTEGDTVSGTSALRKIQVGYGSTGRRGGGRLIYLYYPALDMPIFMMSAYRKNKKSDLSYAEKAHLTNLGEALIAGERKKRKRGQ